MALSVLRWCGRALLALLLTGALLVLGINLLMVIAHAGLVRHAGEPLPMRGVALVLGTSHWSADGRPSKHFEGRMTAAAQLYHQGVAQRLLLSGANPEISYNEPQRMREALLRLGVPEDALLLDYAGRRTLDSVRRARDVFGQQELIIVSQPYHLYRALFLARVDGIQAIGYAAPSPTFSERWRTEWREVGARVLAVLDVYLLDTEPHFPGTGPATAADGA